MKKLLPLFAMAAFLAMGSAHAADSCDAKAVDKNGKPLAGAAKTSFTKKCVRDAVGEAPAAGK